MTKPGPQSKEKHLRSWLFALVFFLIHGGSFKAQMDNQETISEISPFAISSLQKSIALVMDEELDLYLEPNKSSRKLKSFSFGERLLIDREPKIDANKNWVPLVDKSGLAGYAMRSQIRIYEVSRENSVLRKVVLSEWEKLEKRANTQSARSYPSPYNSQYWLSRLTLLDDLSGSEIALGSDTYFYRRYFLKFLNAWSREPNFHTSVKNVKIFPQGWNEYLVQEENSGNSSRLRVNPQLFWELSKRAKGTGEEMHLAREFYQSAESVDCKEVFQCELSVFESGVLPFLLEYPNSPDSQRIVQKYEKIWKGSLAEPESLVCYPRGVVADYTLWNRIKISLQSFETKISKTNHISKKSTIRLKDVLKKVGSVCYPGFETGKIDSL